MATIATISEKRCEKRPPHAERHALMAHQCMSQRAYHVALRASMNVLALTQFVRIYSLATILEHYHDVLREEGQDFLQLPL